MKYKKGKIKGLKRKLRGVMMDGRNGRPLSLTPEMRDEFIKKVRGGASFDTASRSLGLSTVSFYNWQKRFFNILNSLDLENETISIKKKLDKLNPEEKYLFNFFKELQKADADFELRNIFTIQKAAQGDEEKELIPQWTAAAWTLERCFPERYARREKWDIKKETKEVHEYNIYARFSPEEIKAIADIVREIKEIRSGLKLPGRFIDIPSEDK